MLCRPSSPQDQPTAMQPGSQAPLHTRFLPPTSPPSPHLQLQHHRGVLPPRPPHHHCQQQLSRGYSCCSLTSSHSAIGLLYRRGTGCCQGGRRPPAGAAAAPCPSSFPPAGQVLRRGFLHGVCQCCIESTGHSSTGGCSCILFSTSSCCCCCILVGCCCLDVGHHTPHKPHRLQVLGADVLLQPAPGNQVKPCVKAV